MSEWDSSYWDWLSADSMESAPTLEVPPAIQTGLSKHTVDPKRAGQRPADAQRIVRKKADIPPITTADLKGENLAFKLNQVLQILANQIALTQGNNGPFRFGSSPLTFTGVVSAPEIDVHSTIRIRGAADAYGNLRPLVFVSGLPQYADNEDAKAAGLANGCLYRTADGTLKVVY